MDKMDYLHVSPNHYRALAQPDGRYLHWVTQLDEEIPIQMKTSGYGSEQPMTLLDTFKEAVELEHQQEALKIKRGGKWVSWTYAEYNDLAHRFARAVTSLEIGSRKCVNILGFNSPEWAISYVGAVIADCVPVGVYTTSTPDAVQYIGEHSEAELVVVQNEEMLATYLKVLHALPRIKAFVVCFPQSDLQQYNQGHVLVLSWDNFLARGTPEFEAEVERRKQLMTPGRVLTIIYTSGTTGPPKGVLLSHDNFVWSAYCHAAMRGDFERNEQVLSYLPLSHVVAQKDLIASIVQKACVNFADDKALQGTLGQTIKEVRPTSFVGVPRVYEKIQEGIKAAAANSSWLKSKISAWAQEIGLSATMANLEHRPLPWGYSLANSIFFKKVKEALGFDRVKSFYVGAAPISRETLDFFGRLNITIINAYGMSETAGAITIGTMNRCNINSVGFATPGTTVKILDSEGRAVPPRTRGEICLNGRLKFLGYYKNPEATRATVDSSGLLHSGDEGYFDEEGFLFITGRFKELIITAGGENVPPVLIEQSIKGHSKLISNVFVVGDARPYLVALITLRSEPDANAQPSQKLPADLRNYFAEIGSTSTTLDEAARDPKIIAEVDKAVQSANEVSASRAQNIRKWAFIPGDFTVAGGELTPTMKVRRTIVSEKYRTEIDKLYLEPRL
jgi:long-chain-fatty-acid--CoA ligase ACSBG